MSKIVARIKGGIGNQLFTYAAARRMALANNSILLLDDVSGFDNDHVYNRIYQLNHFNIQAPKASFTDRLEPFSRIRRYIKRRKSNSLPFFERSYILQEFDAFDARILDVKPVNTIYLEGYWQSQNYFADIKETIRDDAKIIAPVDSLNETAFISIKNCNSVAVHVRFFDVPTEENGNNAPEDYYKRAFAKMKDIAPDAHYFIFSDNPEAARLKIKLPDDQITFVTHNQGEESAYADLWLMSQCKHFIIANSTFSWWGAWLGTHEGKQVIAPGFEIRQGTTSWGFEGLLPNEWIKL